MSDRIAAARARARLVAAAAALLTPFVAHATARGQALEQQSLTPATGSQFQYFGSSTDTQGDLLVVGTPGDDTKNTDAGSVFVYRFDSVARSWNLEQQLFASDAVYGAEFGYSVALDGDAIVVGAPFTSTGKGAWSGEAYVYRYDAVAKTWHEEQKLLSSVGAANDGFGSAVDMSGDALVVGAEYASPGGHSQAGCAVVFRHQAATSQWIEEAQLVDSNAANSDLAGRSVGIDGATIVVASPNADYNGWLDAGAVNVYSFDGTHWSETAEIGNAASHSQYPIYDHFGTALAIHGTCVAVTADGEDYYTSIGDVGWLHVFEWNGASWVETAAFPNPNLAPSSYFGLSLAMLDDLIVVGHPDDDAFGLADAGSVWLYRRGAQSGWVFDGQLDASDAAAGDRFGAAVGVSAQHLVAGSPRHDAASGNDWGKAYVYDGAELTLTITPANPAPGQPITFEAFRGNPGSLGLLTLEDVGGTPLFLPLLVTAFGADDAITITGNAPNPAVGVQVGLRAYKISPTGPIVKSPLAYADL
jgi:hypothetical protein